MAIPRDRTERQLHEDFGFTEWNGRFQSVCLCR
jgi:hypothetical protein